MPTVLTGSAINLIGGFKAFDIIYVMTQGGPGSATKVTSILMYRLAFTENRFGYACAMAVIVFLLALVLTGLFNKFRGSVDRSVGNALILVGGNAAESSYLQIIFLSLLEKDN